MEAYQLLSFAGAAVILILMPGPDNIFVLTESLVTGKRNGIYITIGLCLGNIFHTLAAATGLSLILSQSPVAFAVIKYAGAAYLFSLAVMAAKDQPMSINAAGNAQSGKSGFQLLKKGFFMNVLNPKVSLFFIAFLPQFVIEGSFSPMLQMIILGMLFVVCCLLIFSSIAFAASFLTPYLNNSKFWKITKTCKITTMCLLGLALLFT